VKLLIIVLTMLGTAAGALHSWHARNQYIQASLLSEAFSLSAQPKMRVADHYLAKGRMPQDNEAAGLPPAKRLYGTSVKRIAVHRGGVLVVDFEQTLGERSLTFTPSVSEVSGLLSWQCTSDSVEPSILSKLEPGCSWLPSTPESRLIKAIANRQMETIRTLIAEGVDVDRVVNGNTPLMLAAKSGDLATVEALLAAGARVDNTILNGERRTPLMIAIAGDRAEIATLLLARGASVTQSDLRDWSAVDHAADADRRLGGQRYSLMVSAGFNPRFAGRADEASPMQASAEQRQAELAALYEPLRAAALDCHVQRLASLFKQERDLATPEQVNGVSMLTFIRKPQCREVLTAHLLTKRSFQRARDARFALAVRDCEARAAESMLRDNPAIDALDRVGDVPHLDRALVVGCTPIVQLFARERPIAGRVPDGLLLTTLRQAPQRQLVALVGSLIRAGVDVDHRDARGETPLALAIGLEQPVVAKVLIDAGSDVDALTADGSTPLIEAAKKGYEHLVQQLILQGANLDARDGLGRTALLAAVAADRLRLVELLVRAGANTRLRDRNGIDALLLADSRLLKGARVLLTDVSASAEY